MLRQCPEQKGIWNNIKFTVEPVEECNYFITLNYLPAETSIIFPAHHIWILLQEPPVHLLKYWHRASKVYYHVFTKLTNLFLRS
ncbi:MAG: hypothetical protein BWY64_00605 [bacterium ADurb.Bin363]|nr:MAG: hypothetical protein BWY64_00605 [bacterium ADurb.Bin363]